jgi:hypothetical protein
LTSSDKILTAWDRALVAAAQIDARLPQGATIESAKVNTLSCAVNARPVSVRHIGSLRMRLSIRR